MCRQVVLEVRSLEELGLDHVVEAELSHGDEDGPAGGPVCAGEQFGEALLTGHSHDAVECVLVAGRKWESNANPRNTKVHIQKALSAKGHVTIHVCVLGTGGVRAVQLSQRNQFDSWTASACEDARPRAHPARGSNFRFLALCFLSTASTKLLVAFEVGRFSPFLSDLLREGIGEQGLGVPV